MNDDPLQSDPVLLATGDRLQHDLEVRSLLGSGGMGQVFEAYDHRLERLVAVKISLPRAGRELLRAEARALASLHHPGLVAIHAMGVHDDSEYVVMERLYGVTLADHLEVRGQLATQEALDILVDVAEALAVVHRAGLAHRDIKPENVMMSPERTVLMDFGIALEDQGQIFGSPYYMAPELITGVVEAPHLLDVYALGVMAYQLLVGEVPYDGDNTTAILAQQLSAPVPLVSHKRAYVSPHLDRLIAEMMAKEPGDRPHSASTVATWMRAIARGRDDLAANGPMSVLIADDDPDMLHLLESCAVHAVPGIEVRTVSSGTAALAQYHASPPDVMLVDLRMPDMNGVELCMHLRGAAHTSNTTMVAVSAYATEEDRALLERLGVVNFVSKKSNSDELVHELVTLMRRLHETRVRILRPVQP